MKKDPYGTLVKNSATFAIANVSSKLLMVILIPYYTFVMTTQEYGVADTMINTVLMLLPLISLGIQNATLRFCMDSATDSRSVFSISLLTVLVTSSLFFLLIPLLQYWGVYEGYLHIFFFLILIQSVVLVLGEYAKAIGKVRAFAISGVLQTIVLGGLTLLFLSGYGMGVKGYLLAYLIALSCTGIYLAIIVSIHKSFSIRLWNRDLFKRMLSYSLPLIPNALMWWVLTMSDRYMIIGFLGFAASGIYAVANKIPTLISFVSNIFYQAGQLSVIEEHDSNKKNVFYTNMFNTYWLGIMVIISALLMVMRPIINFILSSDFRAAADYVPFLLIAVAFSSFSGMLGTLYAASKYTKGAMFSSLAGAGVNIALNSLLIPAWELMGAAIATMIGFLVVAIYRALDTRKCAQIQYDRKLILNSLVIISMQIVLYYQSEPLAYIASPILFFLFCILNRSLLKKIFQKVKNIVKNRKGNT